MDCARRFALRDARAARARACAAAYALRARLRHAGEFRMYADGDEVHADTGCWIRLFTRCALGDRSDNMRLRAWICRYASDQRETMIRMDREDCRLLSDWRVYGCRADRICAQLRQIYQFARWWSLRRRARGTARARARVTVRVDRCARARGLRAACGSGCGAEWTARTLVYGSSRLRIARAYVRRRPYA